MTQEQRTALEALTEGEASPRIVTSHVYPPIPCRDFDWCAWDDRFGADCSAYGWGATEADAISDFRAMLAEGEA
jgi:hypothetical protein